MPERKVLYLVRGLPGSGKTTLARRLAPVCNVAADDYMINWASEYEFDATRLHECHQKCRRTVEDWMKNAETVAEWHAHDRRSVYGRAGEPKHGPFGTIAVHNTFSQRWEAEPYYRLARRYGYEVFVVEAQNQFENTHEVPAAGILAMSRRWEPLYEERGR